MLKAARPYCVFSALRSASICSTSGVEDRDRPKPTTAAAIGGNPSHHTAPPRITLQENTCSDPRPKTVRRMTHSRVGCSSSPMIKRSSTTPNSEAFRMLDTSVMSRSPQGPMMSPAAMKPSTEENFSRRNSETATTAAVSRIATCASEIIQGSDSIRRQRNELALPRHACEAAFGPLALGAVDALATRGDKVPPDEARRRKALAAEKNHTRAVPGAQRHRIPA